MGAAEDTGREKVSESLCSRWRAAAEGRLLSARKKSGRGSLVLQLLQTTGAHAAGQSLNQERRLNDRRA